MITLYKVNEAGALSVWNVQQAGPNKIVVTWGMKGGAKQIKYETVETNESGRTLDEQIDLRMKSRASRQLDRGYQSTAELAHTNRHLNAAGLLRPMLAKTYDGTVKGINNGAVLQYKYNGHRCLISNIDGKLSAYSRYGKPITTIAHILDDLDIPEGMTLDGELYVHEQSLQDTSSLIKRAQKGNSKLSYVVYDQVSPVSFLKRYEELYDIGIEKDGKVVIAPLCHWDQTHITRAQIEEQAIDKGYEGLMIRVNNKGYEPGKRSDQLLKVKRRLDAEYEVVSIEPSKDGWAILHCRLPSVDGTTTTFKVTAPGNMQQKREIFVNSPAYIGREVIVEYAELTKDGVPFHCVATGFKEII